MSDIIKPFEQFMFSSENIPFNRETINNYKKYTTKESNTKESNTKESNTKESNTKESNTKESNTKLHKNKIIIKNKPQDLSIFTPSQKDKLFWCFFIIANGYQEYELSSINSFVNEKNFKIETVEKLKLIKDKLKEFKLRRTELEEEFVSNEKISLKGLLALCLMYDVSITYVYGKKYCKLNYNDSNNKVGIIIQNDKKEDSIKWIMNKETNNEIKKYLQDVYDNYWYIENVQKPLKSPASYSTSELHDICNKLNINIEVMNDKTNKLKSKTKKQLYDEILQKV